MGICAYLLNLTKKQHVRLGKYGEEDPIFILRKTIELLDWSLEDEIRTVDDYDDDLSCVLEDTSALTFMHNTGNFR